MSIPDDLRYTTDHEWVRRDGERARVGITDYAQDALGDVVFVDLPQVGEVVAVSAGIGEVESTKSVSDLYAPLTGTITEINDALDATPGLLNSDPYGEGWLCVLTIDDPSQYEALLDAAAYTELTGEI